MTDLDMPQCLSIFLKCWDFDGKLGLFEETVIVLINCSMCNCTVNDLFHTYGHLTSHLEHQVRVYCCLHLGTGLVGS